MKRRRSAPAASGDAWARRLQELPGADRQGRHDHPPTIECGLDPTRTVAVSLTGDANKRITIMMPPNGDPLVRDAAAAMFAKTGTR